jgi:integrase
MAGRTQKLPRGISQRGANYRVRVTFEGERYQVGEYPTLALARAALDIARSQVVRGTFEPVPQRWKRHREEREARKAAATTVEDWAEQWLTQLEHDKRSPGTLKSYRSTLSVHVLPIIGGRTLSDVTAEHVEGLTAGKTDATKYAISRTLSSMFGAAVKAGKLAESPVTVRFAKTVRTKDDASIAELDEVAALAAAMPERLRVSVWLAAIMALRIGEVLGLQRRDLDLDAEAGPVLHIRRQWLIKASPPSYGDPKAGSAGKLAIPASLVPVLRAHLDRFTGPDPESPVLPSTIDKRAPVSQTTFDKAWRAARDQVKPGLHYHDLRAVALTLYNRQGATAEELMRRGRHTDLDTATVYQGVTAARDRTLTARLDEALREVIK